MENEKIKPSEKQNFVMKLINIAMFHSIGRFGGVGYHIKNIRGKDREIMENLTAKDFNHRIL